MKKFAGLLLCSGFLFNSLSAIAQTYPESALLFSRTSIGGSARVQAMGGAQVSLGGDFSSAYSNPAGLGMYNRSEITLSPGFTSTRSAADYLSSSNSSVQGNVNLQGFSLVIHRDKNNGKLLGGTFGVTYNRTNNFNNTLVYSGKNLNTSIIDYYANDAGASASYFSNNSNNLGPNQLFYNPGYLYETPTRLAYDQYLINQNSATDSTHYSTDVNGIPTQHEVVHTKGSQSQFNVSYGVNLSDRVFIGGGIGLASLNYQISRTYTETFPTAPLNSLIQTESLNTQSSIGINATLGTIIRPVDFFQFGLSIATPTHYALEDNYGATLSTNWDASSFNSLYPGATIPTPSATDVTPVDYTLNTPWRFSGGATFFIQKHGFISADIEYLDYSKSHYTTAQDDGSFDPDNADIKSFYKSVFNYRIGGEYRLNKFRFRAGYNFMPDPFKGGQSPINNSIQSISVGAGYRTSKFFVDLAVIQRQGTTLYHPYSPNSPHYSLDIDPTITVKNTSITGMVTVGIILPSRR